MKWFIITKEGCPSCEALKKYFREKNQQFVFVEMPSDKNKDLKPYMVSKLKEIGFGVKETYPMVFTFSEPVKPSEYADSRSSDVKYVGGYNDVIALKI